MILLTAARDHIDPSDPRPVVDDPLVMAMRPSGRRVGLVRTALDGGGDFTSLADAIAYGQSLQAAALAESGLATLTPNFRVDHLVDPGVHTPDGSGWDGSIPAFMGFYATDPTPGSTRVEWGLEGGGFYWEGIDVTAIDPTADPTAFDPKYPFHLHAGRSTTIITRCTLTNARLHGGGGDTPIGMDGLNGATLVMHDVALATGAYTNLHGELGTPAPSWEPMDVVFSRCRFATGSLYHSTLYDPDQTEMWVVGCTADTAGLKGDRSVLHLDPATVLARTTGSYAGHTKLDGSAATGLTDSRTDWPVPTGGLSARDRAYYGM